jgi:glycosyltransferase involved in cell wall biosynthesis/ubiquinone/menaquinone biosynthesis C-methylase UbiE
MVVRRDFEELYRSEEDPWSIGAADSDRYRIYRDLLRERRPPSGFASALDLGCGKGAFTVQLASLARQVTGVDLSEIAVAKARAEHPEIRFLQGDARRLEDLSLPHGSFDLVVCSDLIAYFTPREAERFLREISRLLSPDGCLFLAAWSPGGRYYTAESLEQVLTRHFAILRRGTLPSRHAFFLARRRWTDLVLTLDYETWQPLPPGKRVDWYETVLRPAEALMLTAERFSAPLTFFVEMGEMLYLRRHDPAVAAALEDQIREARRRGHDIQLHLHPEWLPESAPRHDPATGSWWWDEGKNRIHWLAESPRSLLLRLQEELERIVRPADPRYQVLVFRAGKYRIQPHEPVFRALQECGIRADSSVWRGGHSFQHRFDFRAAWSGMNPYFPSPSDINLPAPPAEETILEFPIRSSEGGRLSLDGASAEKLLKAFDGCRERDRLSRFKELHPDAWRRIATRLRRLPGARKFPRLEREPAGDLNPQGDDTVVAIGHTKGAIPPAELEAFLSTLRGREEVRFRGFSDVVRERLSEREARRETPREILEAQVARESEAVLGEERNEAQSRHLQAMVPLDRERVLDLGCGAGYWTKILAKRHGFCLGVDCGAEFLRKARSVHAVPVLRADFHRLPLGDSSCDAVYADNVLEHSHDPSRLLSEVYRVLSRRGMLAAALPPDARGWRYPVSDHLWKTDRADLERRLRGAGFTRVRVEEMNTVDAFEMASYPASGNAMLYVTAWKNDGEEYSDRARANDLMEFVYRKLDPSRSQESLDAETILQGGAAWCLGYCAVLGEMARREGIDRRFVTLEARDHPRGRGRDRRDTHELVELFLGGGWLACDPMANRILEGSVEEILADPSLADRAARSRLPDERFRGRGYHLYCSAFFYERVHRYCRRSSLTSGEAWHWVTVRRRKEKGGHGSGRIRRLRLTDGPGADDESAESAAESNVRVWTRKDFSSRGWWNSIRALRGLEEERFEILSEDLRWHERVIRLHLLGALAHSREKALMDRQGRREPLGWRPLVTRQLPSYLAGRGRAAAAFPRIRLALAALSLKRRRDPGTPASRRGASVLYLRSDLWRSLRAGGSVGHIAGMAEAFRSAGQRVRFLCADPPAGISPEVMPVLVVPPPPEIRVSRSAARFLHSFALSRAGSDRLFRDPPGMIYHRFDEGSIAGILLSRALRVPLVLEYNGSGVWIADHWDRPLPHRGTFRAIERQNLRHAHLVVTVSRVLREELLAKGVEPHRILLCPNGVDPGVFRPDRDGLPVRRRLDLEGRTVIGFIGTFGPWHGAEVLARAAGEVIDRRPETAVLFMGDGPRMQRVREILREAGIEDRCRFTGLVPQEEAPDYLAACDIFASPHVPNPDGSRFFGSPTKLFEYMAMGRGIVASELEQIGEVLEEERTALLVPPGSAGDLATALERLVADRPLRDRLGAAAREAAVSRHTWDRNALAVLDAVRFL